jgi:hypothetical protein
MKQRKDLVAKTINTMLMTYCKDKLPGEKEALEIVGLAYKMIEELDTLCNDGYLTISQQNESVNFDVSNEIDL